jgi:hypothetical protein
VLYLCFTCALLPLYLAWRYQGAPGAAASAAALLLLYYFCTTALLYLLALFGGVEELLELLPLVLPHFIQVRISFLRLRPRLNKNRK